MIPCPPSLLRMKTQHRYNATSSITFIDKMLITKRCNMAAQVFQTLLLASFLLQLNWQHGPNISRRTELPRQTCSDFHPLLNSLLSFRLSSLSSLLDSALAFFIGYHTFVLSLLGYPLCCRLHFLFWVHSLFFLQSLELASRF